MISEVAFARDYGSSWRMMTPLMDGFVRQLNAGLYDRDFPPSGAATAANRRAFVNEVAFEVFCAAVRKRQVGGIVDPIVDIVDVVSPIVQADARRRGWEGDYSGALSDDEQGDVEEQIRRFQARLGVLGGMEHVICKPSFPGCGIIDRCEGDLIIRETLIEVKAGDRLFRAIDVRQVLTYLALNYKSSSHDIRSVMLFNPRVGISLRMDVDEICFELSGAGAPQLLDAISYVISSGDVSR